MFLNASLWISVIWFSAKSMVSINRRSENIWKSTLVRLFRARSTVPTRVTDLRGDSESYSNVQNN